MSEQRLREIQDRLNAATPGPWIYESQADIHGFPGDEIHYVTPQDAARDDDPPMTSFYERADALLVANAPTDLSWLIQEHYRLLSRIAYLEGWKQSAEEGYQKEREA